MRVSTLIFLLLAALTNRQVIAQESILNIYNWADYIDPQIIDDFEELYDIEVNYDIYDSSEMVDTKLMTGSSGYDLVVHSASFAARLSPIGVFAPVDRSKLKNWHHIDPEIIETVEEHYKQPMMGVPYMWGTTGITYNVDMIRKRMPDAPVDSMALIFDPEIVSKFADCGVSFLDDPTTVIPFAMLYLGYANASKSATPLVDKSITSDIGIYPDEETKKRLVPTIVLEPKLERRRSRTWTKVKTGL